jgi:hypothetical protein
MIRSRYIIRCLDSDRNPIELRIEEEGNAERILRGLIHSGFEVSIQEEKYEVPSLKKEKYPSEDAIRSACEPNGYPANGGGC